MGGGGLGGAGKKEQKHLNSYALKMGVTHVFVISFTHLDWCKCM